MEKCIVKGPFLCDDERDEDKEETHTFESDLMILGTLCLFVTFHLLQATKRWKRVSHESLSRSCLSGRSSNPATHPMMLNMSKVKGKVGQDMTNKPTATQSSLRMKIF